MRNDHFEFLKLLLMAQPFFNYLLQIKGVSHSSAGYLLYAMVTMKHAFDYNQVKRNIKI